ncbi:uncharacterized protein RBU33_016999 isoform 1-T1 [Hipposideros larvatus]
MLREVSSGVLKRPSLASVYFNIFNLDEDMEEFFGEEAQGKQNAEICVSPSFSAHNLVKVLTGREMASNWQHGKMVKKKHPGTSMLCMPKKTGAEPRKQPRLLAQNALLGLLDHIS